MLGRQSFASAKQQSQLTSLLRSLALLAVAQLVPGACLAESVIQWKNGSGQDVATEINNGNVFTGNFKGSNDVHVSKVSGPSADLYSDTFGGSTPGNNPAWVTNFVGNSTQETGNGTAGTWTLLETSSSANSIQFDFSIPLGPGDRMLISDVDQSEKYQIAAYTLVGGNYVAAPLTGWAHQAFSGQTGVTPDARWAVWNASDGTLTSAGSSLNEPLDVLAPNQNIDRVLFITVGGGGGTPAVQFATDIAHVSLLGDYNQNGVVDAPDYVKWRNELGATYTQADYDVWRSHFGQTAGGGSGAVLSAPVPEPATAAALLIGSLVLGLHRAVRRPKVFASHRR